MAIVELFLLTGLGCLTGWLLYTANQQRQQERQMENAFYQLLEDQDSRISSIQLAAKAKVNPQIVKEYLEQQAKSFSALPEVDADGSTFYRFPQLHFKSASDSDKEF